MDGMVAGTETVEKEQQRKRCLKLAMNCDFLDFWAKIHVLNDNREKFT